MKVIDAVLIAGVLAWAGGIVSPARAQTIRELNEQGLDSLLHHRNGRPLVLNLWATWCEPCREEFPDLIRTAKEFPGVEVAVVSADYPDEVDSKIRPFVASVKIPFPVYVSGFKKQEDLINTLSREWSGALPATFVYSKEGEQRIFVSGKQSRTKFRELFKRAAASAP